MEIKAIYRSYSAIKKAKEELKKEHGAMWKKLYRIKKNYPFGKKSKCVWTIWKK